MDAEIKRKESTELITGLGVEVGFGSSQGELNLCLCFIFTRNMMDIVFRESTIS